MDTFLSPFWLAFWVALGMYVASYAWPSSYPRALLAQGTFMFVLVVRWATLAGITGERVGQTLLWSILALAWAAVIWAVCVFVKRREKAKEEPESGPS